MDTNCAWRKAPFISALKEVHRIKKENFDGIAVTSTPSFHLHFIFTPNITESILTGTDRTTTLLDKCLKI